MIIPVISAEAMPAFSRKTGTGSYGERPRSAKCSVYVGRGFGERQEADIFISDSEILAPVYVEGSLTVPVELEDEKVTEERRFGKD